MLASWIVSASLFDKKYVKLLYTTVQSVDPHIFADPDTESKNLADPMY